MDRERLMCRGGASSIPKKSANLGHRFCHLMRSLLVMLKAWFAHFGHENRKDRRKPAMELNEQPAVVVRETSQALQLTPPDHQLMSERGILSLKPDLRLDRHDETQKPDRSASLGDSGASSTRITFSVHRPKNRLSQDFWRRSIFDSCNSICQEETPWGRQEAVVRRTSH